MKDIPFTSYDFWGYLTSGFVLLFVVDYALDTHLFGRPTWSTVDTMVAIACVYAMGHVIAGLASWLWEDKLLRRWTGIPTNILMGKPAGPWVLRTFCRGYYRALSPATIALIVAKAEVDKVPAEGEGLFGAAYNATRGNARAQARMDNFLNQYGLCRNLSFTSVLAAVVLTWSAATGRHVGDGWWAVLAAFLAVAMYLRYMKFYRHFANEVLTTYAHTK